MTLQELRYLVALADKGHFVRAAEACHVGQSTLSTQLMKLEADLGVTLFERNKHLLRATAVGVLIIERARRALDVVGEIRGLAIRDHEPMEWPLRLGVIPTLGPYLIPHVLTAIRTAFPKLQLFLREDLTSNLLERLRQGTLDALLLALPVRGDDIVTTSLFREAFVVALPKEHSLARRKQVVEADLMGENVLLLEEGHCMREQALAICGMAMSSEREELKATSIETLRLMVAAGVGCTLLPRLASLPGVGSINNGMVQIRPFSPPEPTRTIGLAWRTSYRRDETIRALADVIVANLPSAIGALAPGARGASLDGAAPSVRSRSVSAARA